MTDRLPCVVFVAHDVHDDGGMERAIAQLIRTARADYEVVVISSQLAADLRPLVKWRRVRLPRRPRPLHFVLFFVVAGLRLRRERADLVHTLGAVVPNRADVATVAFCHAAYRQQEGRVDRPVFRRVNSALSRRLGRAAERWSYGRGRIRLLAAVSNGVAGELNRHYPLARVVVTPNGVDVDRFRPDPKARREVRAAEGVSAGEIVAVFVGGDWDHKGLMIAIDALALARARGAQGEGLRLWVVGRGDEARFRSQVRQTGIAEQIRFFGFRRDVERFLKAADLFVMPSAYETFSVATFEAAASSLPVVATRLHAVDELVGDDEAGLIVERHPEAFSRALVQLASDPSRRRAMGEAGRRRVSSFTWERSTASVLEIYRDLLGGAQASRRRAA